MSLLEIDHLSVTFGGLRAVDEVDMAVEQGQLVGLIGPNGAGKTTFVDGLTGFVPTTGTITFAGRDISNLPAHRRARAGLGRSWQSLELFDDLTVAENLQVAADRLGLIGFFADLVAPGRRRDGASVERALSTLDIVDLAGRMPRELSQGQRKLVGIARALPGGPRLVCMDDPAAGLDTAESQDLGARLRAVVDAGTTVFLIDHDMHLVLNICDVIHVIEFGRIIASGPPAAIRTDERVITAYLGEAARRDMDEAKAAVATASRGEEA